MEKGMVGLLAVLLASGCMQLGKSKARELDRMADTAVAKFTQENTGLRWQVDASPGYLVADQTGMNIALIDGGFGGGVLVDNVQDKRTYVKVSHLDMEGGTGANSYKVLFLFSNRENLEKAQAGEWSWEAGGGGEIRKVHVYADGNPTTSYALNAIKLTPYERKNRKEYWIFSGK